MIASLSRIPGLKIGLTGGIGAGKSCVAAWLAEWGAAVVDTDEISHRLTAPGGQALPAIVEDFGQRALNAEGGLDRAWMREQIFTEPALRKRLEAILHPRIEQEVATISLSAQGLYLVWVVPLLVESGRWIDQVDRVCVVDCDTDTQIRRALTRSGLTIAMIRRIIGIQAPRQARLAVAHDVILNDGDTPIDLLRERTNVHHDQWCTQAANAGRAMGQETGKSA